MKKIIVLVLVGLVCYFNFNRTTNSEVEAKPTNISLHPPQSSEPVTVSTNSSASFPFPLVKWSDKVYKVTTFNVTEVEVELGEITSFSTIETDEKSNSFSNVYAVGTKIWSIKDVDVNDAIAIDLGNNVFVKAVSSYNNEEFGKVGKPTAIR